MSAPDQPAQSPDQPAESPRPSRGPLAVLSVVGLVLGVGIGLLIGYFVFDEDEAAQSADSDLAAACDLAERLRHDHQTADDWGSLGEDPAWDQGLAIGSLLRSAGTIDEQRSDMYDLGTDLMAAVTRVQLDEAVGLVATITEECGRL